MMKEMKRAILFLLVILMCVFSSAASAEAYFVLDLPAALNIIDAAAFEGAASLEKVVVPEGTTKFGTEPLQTVPLWKFCCLQQ